jgi:hypothetical protein
MTSDRSWNMAKAKKTDIASRIRDITNLSEI